LERLMISDVQKVSGSIERKICAVGITRLLCDSEIVFKGDYAKFWVPLLQALIELLELPEDDSIPDDEHFIDVEETPGYQTAYSQLLYANRKEVDPCAQVTDLRLNLIQSIYQLSMANPGKLQEYISKMSPIPQSYLQTYLLQAKINLA